VKYDRELWSTTVDAMKRIEEIKVKRQNLFIKKRLTVGRQIRNKADMRLVEKHPEVIRNPAAKRIAAKKRVEEVKDEPMLMEEA